MELICPHHPSSTHKVKDLSGFENLELKRCGEKCLYKMSCGHICQENCHLTDRSHVNQYQCQEPCSKSCTEDHPCQKSCSEKCYPCLHTEEKALTCGHVNEVPCASLRKPLKCSEIISYQLKCGHEAEVQCGQEGDVKCDEKCDFVLKCGHSCDLPCHDDRKHLKKCLKSCTRMKLGCQDNHPCDKPCWMQCDPCQVKVFRDLPCGHHNVEMFCSDKVEEFRCMTK